MSKVLYIPKKVFRDYSSLNHYNKSQELVKIMKGHYEETFLLHKHLLIKDVDYIYMGDPDDDDAA